MLCHKRPTRAIPFSTWFPSLIPALGNIARESSPDSTKMSLLLLVIGVAAPETAHRRGSRVFQSRMKKLPENEWDVRDELCRMTTDAHLWFSGQFGGQFD